MPMRNQTKDDAVRIHKTVKGLPYSFSCFTGEDRELPFATKGETKGESTWTVTPSSPDPSSEDAAALPETTLPGLSRQMVSTREKDNTKREGQQAAERTRLDHHPCRDPVHDY
jgi:hypothetical protein